MTQAMLMGSVASVITLLFLLLAGLDNPFQEGVGGLQPVAMERALTQIDEALGAVDARGADPVRRDRGTRRRRDACSETGRVTRFELVATVLLALATVATAWSGYQASRWNGEQAKAFSRANAPRIESSKADGARQRADAGRRR